MLLILIPNIAKPLEQLKNSGGNIYKFFITYQKVAFRNFNFDYNNTDWKTQFIQRIDNVLDTHILKIHFNNVEDLQFQGELYMYFFSTHFP